jgi:all-trans-retinol 13,14-reductase
MMMMIRLSSEKYDAIIIGSGLGGLACGLYLAECGRKVLTLEKNITPGGCASSFRRDCYNFDSGLHMICGVGKAQHLAKPFEILDVADRIEFIKLKYWMRTIFPEHDIRFPSGDKEAIIRILEKNFPNEINGIRSFFAESIRIFYDLIKFLDSTAPMWQQLPVFPFRYRSLFPVMKKTIKQLLDRHLKDEKLKALLFSNWGFYGLPPSKVNMLPLVGNVAYWLEGAYYPKGGNQMISNAFVEQYKRNGGKIVLGAEVSKIIIEDGKALGVQTRKGDEYFGEVFISNASAIETFYGLVGKEKLPPKFVTGLDRMEPSVSCFMVYLGLDEKFGSTLGNREDYDIVVSDTYDLDEDYRWIMDCAVEKASFFITLYSNIDKSLAKNNKFVASVFMGQPYSYWKKFEASYFSGDKNEYNKEKDRLASILIKRAEKVIPELSKHIEVIEIATPLTLKRFTGNFDGAAYGWANTADQFTPMDRLGKVPIKNLYLCSAWAFPGEGQAPAVAGGYRLGKQLFRERKSLEKSIQVTHSAYREVKK